MSIFRCEKCGCIENTAMCRYWFSVKKLCSECDPKIGKWHGCFDKKLATKEDEVLNLQIR